MTQEPVYLDYNATTPVDEHVLAAMLPYFSEQFGNASSPHAIGSAAKEAVELARHQLTTLVGARTRDIIFTSGATEANNLALFGVAARSTGRRHVVSCAAEHQSVLEPLRRLQRQGFSVDLCRVDGEGDVDLDELRDLCTTDTLLVSVMAANNETGVLAPLAEIGRIASSVGAYFHTDATQMVGKLPINMREVGASLLSLSAHKFYGPKGVGALVMDRSVRLEPLLEGGGQERGHRSGTINVAGCVGAGAAAALAADGPSVGGKRVAQLRDELEAALMRTIHNTRVNGGPNRLPNTTNLSFRDVDADAVLAHLPRVAVSTGSACSSATPAASHVLLAMGRREDEANSAIRVSLGRRTTEGDIAIAAQEFRAAVDTVRSRTTEVPT